MSQLLITTDFVDRVCNIGVEVLGHYEVMFS